MSAPQVSETPAEHSAARFEPYFRLVRSLLPRASSLAIFSVAGELLWSSDTMTGPDLMNVVEDALTAARSNEGSAGQLRTLAGNLPVYLCSLRDEAGGLLAIVAVVCRPNDGGDRKNQDFSFANSLLAPALECLRRELISHANIEELNGSLAALNRDLELVLSHGAADAPVPDGAADLQLLLQQTIEHLRASTGALLVPEKNVMLVRSADARPPDTQFWMRAHRRLMPLAQAQREPLILNETQSIEAPEAFPFRVLCCSLRSRTGRPIGVLALLREPLADAFGARDAHVGEILARKAMSAIESNYDPLSGLYTRPAFERRLKSVLADARTTSWSALYIDVDQLHAINENSGMHVGDALLGQLGELIRQRLPPGAFGARISGDRFAVMLPADIGDAEAFAESLREGSERLVLNQGEGHLPISISIGVAPLEANQPELSHALATAETACKAAKDRGRNRVEVYRASDVSIVRRFADIGIVGRLHN